MRAAMTHELAHAWFADSRGCVARTQPTCEKNANFHAVEVLQVGYPYDRLAAITMVYNLPAAEVRVHPKPSVSHPDVCDEVRDFEARTRTQ